MSDGLQPRWADGEQGPKLEKQQRVLSLAEEALGDIKEFDTCTCPAFSQSGYHHRIGCIWVKVQEALTAISELKE